MPSGLRHKRKGENNAGLGGHLTPAVSAKAARLCHKTSSACVGNTHPTTAPRFSRKVPFFKLDHTSHPGLVHTYLIFFFKEKQQDLEKPQAPFMAILTFEIQHGIHDLIGVRINFFLDFT